MTAADRRAICATCPERKPIPLVRLHKCAVCGCLIEGKTLLPRAKCPKGKW